MVDVVIDSLRTIPDSLLIGGRLLNKMVLYCPQRINDDVNHNTSNSNDYVLPCDITYNIIRIFAQCRCDIEWFYIDEDKDAQFMISNISTNILNT